MIFFITRPVVPFPILQSVFRGESNKLLLRIQILQRTLNMTCDTNANGECKMNMKHLGAKELGLY